MVLSALFQPLFCQGFITTQTNTLVLNRRSQIQHFDKCHFEYHEQAVVVSTISEITNISDFDSVNTIGKVHVLSRPIKFKLSDGKE